MENSSPPRMFGRLRTAIASVLSADSPWRSRLDIAVAAAIIVTIVGHALWEPRSTALAAGILAALGLLLAIRGFSSLRAVHCDRQAMRRLPRVPVPQIKEDPDAHADRKAH